MAVRCFAPSNTISLGNIARCIICSSPKPLETMTIGSSFTNGLPAFACTTHLNDRTNWITKWALFEAEEHNHNNTENGFEGWNNG